MCLAMRGKTNLNLLPVDLGEESLGQRLKRFRKARGFTQQQLCEKTGLVQGLLSDYERDRIRPYPEMLVRFAFVLGVSVDELLGFNRPEVEPPYLPSMRLLRRMKKMEELPAHEIKSLLQIIDAFIERAENKLSYSQQQERIENKS